MIIDIFGIDYIDNDGELNVLEVNCCPNHLIINKDKFSSEEDYLNACLERARVMSESIVNIYNDNKDQYKGICFTDPAALGSPQYEEMINQLNLAGVKTIHYPLSVETGHMPEWIKIGRMASPAEWRRTFGDKVIGKKVIGEHPLTTTPKMNFDEYSEGSVFPNIVLKSANGSWGRDIYFLNIPVKDAEDLLGQMNKGPKKDFFLEKYIKGSVITKYIGYDGLKYIEKDLDGRHIYDIRCCIARANEKLYPIYTMKRISKDPLLERCPPIVPEENRLSYLTNVSQGSTIGYFKKEEKERIEAVSKDLLDFLFHKRNLGKKKNIFWNKSLSSIYRVMDCFLSGFEVNTFYVDEGREEELALLREIRASLISKNKDLASNFKEIKVLRKSKKQNKYGVMLRYAGSIEEDVEVCATPYSRFVIENSLSPIMMDLISWTDGYRLNHKFLLKNKKNGFSNLVFPCIDFKKYDDVNLIYYISNRGFLDIIPEELRDLGQYNGQRAICYALWSGGFASTATIILSLLMKRPVQPIYINKLGTRSSSKAELKAIQALTKKIKNIFPAFEKTLLDPIIVRGIGESDTTGPLCDSFLEGSTSNDVPLSKRLSAILNVFLHLRNELHISIRKDGSDDYFAMNSYLASRVASDDSPPLCETDLFGDLKAPLIEIDDKGIVRVSKKFNFYEILKDTWSCTQPRKGKPCKKCKKCVSRIV